MKKISRLVFFLIAAVIAGGAVFLVTWDIPAPLETIEKVLPDDRFPH
jgi:cell division septal protein FtsQ